MGPLRDVPVLQGALVRLEPLSGRHGADLADAAEEDRSAYGFTWVPRRDEIDDYLHSQFQRAVEGKLIPFAQIRMTDQRAVGCTAYGNPRTWPNRTETSAVEIGWTWLGATAQRSGINVESKLLLFTYAFEQLGVARVDIKTDARNEKSRLRHPGPGRPLRRRAQELVGIVGSRRRGPAARLRHVFRRGGGMAGMSEAPRGSARPLRLTGTPPVTSMRDSIMTTTHDGRDPTAPHGDSPLDTERRHRRSTCAPRASPPGSLGACA